MNNSQKSKVDKSNRSDKTNKTNKRINKITNFFTSKSDAIYLNIVNQIDNSAESTTVHQDLPCENCTTLRKRNEELEAENRKLLKDNKSMKMLMKKYEQVNMIKDIQLNKQQTITVPPKADEILFKSKEAFFELEQIKRLRSCKKGKSNDSTFVTNLVSYLWPDGNVEKLCVAKRGTSIKKDRISPRKKKIIDEMLEERVCSENIDEGEKLSRCERSNRLIGFALTNIKRRKAKLQQK